MSRTKHNSKGPGHDYWGKRAESGNCGYGKFVKQNTARRERRDAQVRVERGETVDRQWDK